MIDKRKSIAKNIARYFEDGDFINLGVGIPTQSANYIPDGVNIFLHAESGFAGQEGALKSEWNPKTHNREEAETAFADPRWTDKENGWKKGHRDLIDASGGVAILKPGACCFDTATSFIIARGGHLDKTVLGGLQVDEEGNLANWRVPGRNVPGMGGAMDLARGAKKVIVAMEHCTKTGEPKILKKCTFPLTAVACVSVIVTDLAAMEFIDGKLTVVGMMPGVTKEEIIAKTEAEVFFADEIRTLETVSA